MRKTLVQIAFVCAIALLAAFSINAQSAGNVEPEIKQFIEAKAKKSRVPAEINSVVRGDLNGDGKEDAAVQYYIQVGYPGNLTNTYIAVFLNKNGKMRLIADVDSIAVPTAIQNGEIVADKYGAGDKKFEKVGTIVYKLNKNKLVEVKAVK